MTEITIGMRDKAMVGDGVLFWGLFLISGVIWLWSVQADIKDYLSSRNPRRSSTLICGICFVVLIFFIRNENKKPFKKENLMQVVHEGTWNYSKIHFKMDSTFIWEGYYGLYTEYVYGRYLIDGDTIRLDQNPNPNVFDETTFIIAPDTTYIDELIFGEYDKASNAILTPIFDVKDDFR